MNGLIEAENKAAELEVFLQAQRELEEARFFEHPATGGESLAEFARNAGMDNPDRAWLLDPRDVWVANPCYSGPPVPHPEDDSYWLHQHGMVQS